MFINCIVLNAHYLCVTPTLRFGFLERGIYTDRELDKVHFCVSLVNLFILVHSTFVYKHIKKRRKKTLILVGNSSYLKLI